MSTVEERVSTEGVAAGGDGSRPDSGSRSGGSGRQRRVASVGGVRGVLVLGEDGWVVGNDSEVRLLEGLRGERGARDRLWALAAVLDEGLVEPGDLRRLCGRLSAISAVETVTVLWRVRVPGYLRAAVAFVCSCVDEEMLSRWLRHGLAARLDANLVRGLLPGPGWDSWNVPHRLRWRTFDRDVHWLSEMPESFWERLGAHRDGLLRDVAVASDPRARPKALDEIAVRRSHVHEVMDLVACNPRTPTKVLRDLMHRSYSMQRAVLRVAQSRSASRRLLGEMSKSWNWESRYVAAWHPRVPAVALRRLVGDEPREVRAAVARADAAPQRVLEVLASDGEVLVRRSVASNRSAAVGVLGVLLGDRRAEVRAAAVANETTPPEMAAVRVGDRAVSVRCEVAARPVGADVLAVLATDASWRVRRAVAWNSQTTQETLDALAGDACGEVRAAVASNSNTRPSTLEVLAGDDSWWVRNCVVANRACPVGVLVALAGDEDFDVGGEAAENPSMPPAQLEALARHEAWWVRAGVALNTRSPEGLLAVLSEDECSDVRRCVCENDEAPRRLVDALRCDEDYWVRAAAAAAYERRRAHKEGKTPPKRTFGHI